MKYLIVSSLLATVFVTGGAQAGEINKCVDAKGNITYTDASCSSSQSLERRFEPMNPKPGGNDTVRMAPPAPVAPPQPSPPPAAAAQVPVQVIQPPPVVHTEPSVIYVPVGDANAHRYSDWNRRPNPGWQHNRPDYRPPRPQPSQPRPVWRGENDATRALIQGGGQRGPDNRTRGSWHAPDPRRP